MNRSAIQDLLSFYFWLGLSQYTYRAQKSEVVNTLSRLNNALYSKIIHKLSIYDRYVRSLKSTVICAEVPLMADSRRDKLLWNTEVSRRKMFIPLTVAVDIKWQIFDAILRRIIGLHYLRVTTMITKVNCYTERGMTCSQWLFTMYGVKTKLIQKHRHWLVLPDLFWGEVDIKVCVSILASHWMLRVLRCILLYHRFLLVVHHD